MPPPSGGGDGDDGDDYDDGDDKDNIDDGDEKEREDILSFIRYLQRIIQWMAEYLQKLSPIISKQHNPDICQYLSFK